MGTAADMSGIQFRLLNRSKGPAVQGPRTQSDRKLYLEAIQSLLAKQDFTVIEGEASALLSSKGVVTGVQLSDGSEVLASAVILTAGTFMRGTIHIGDKRVSAGRMGEGAADKSLNDKSKKSGIPVGILKQVFKRGVKAWQTGHRPGTTAVQWGHARVNSFITKGKGTWGKADKDLADKVRGESNEGLWDNIRKKKERIKKGSGEKMGNKNSVDIDAYNKAKNSK
jgi:tRNA U34 5-carboxymethylaminomethyl modifying enzyme MnmG/GidA